MTPGKTIDQRYVAERLARYTEAYDVDELVYDPWSSHVFIRRIVDELGFPEAKCIEHRQGFVSMSALAKLFEKLVLEGKLIHNENPLLRSQVSGVMLRIDPAENIKPDKTATSTSRIDAVVATIMALGRAALHADDESNMDSSPLVVGW